MRDNELRKIISKVNVINEDVEPLNMHANIERLSNQALLLREKQQKAAPKKAWNSRLSSKIALAAAAIVITVTGAIIGANVFGSPTHPFVQSIGQSGAMHAGGSGTIELTPVDGEVDVTLPPMFIILRDGQLDGIYIWLPEGAEREEWSYYKDTVMEGGVANAPGWLKNNKDGAKFFSGTETLAGKNPKFTYRVEFDDIKGWRVIKSQGKIEAIIWMPAPTSTPTDGNGGGEVHLDAPEFIAFWDGLLDKTVYIWLPEGAKAESKAYYWNIIRASVPGWANSDAISFIYDRELTVKNGNSSNTTTFRIEKRGDSWCVTKNSSIMSSSSVFIYKP